MKRKILWVILALVLLVVLLFAVVFGGDYFSGALDTDTVSYTVKSGAGTLAVAADLKEEALDLNPLTRFVIMLTPALFNDLAAEVNDLVTELMMDFAELDNFPLLAFIP